MGIVAVVPPTVEARPPCLCPDIVAPVMLSLSLVIVVHPLRARFERHMPRWAASVIVLITTVMLILSLAIAVAVSLGQLAKLIPTYATEMNGYVADIGEGLKNLGVGSDQSDSMVNSADVGKLVDLVTSILANVLDTLTSLFFIVTLLAFLAFDSAKTERLAEGARRLYSIDPSGLDDADRQLERYRSMWTAGLAALHTEVARGKRSRRSSAGRTPREEP